MSHYDEEREAYDDKLKEVNKGGRPLIVLDDDQVKQVESLGAVLSIEQMADYFSISRTTFYQIMERQPEVSVHYKRGKSKAIGGIAKSLLTKAQGGDNQAMIFYLKTQAGWKETNVVDNTSSDGSMTPRRSLDDFYS